MTTLTQFLLARIAEDEDEARNAVTDGERMERHFARRVLAECEAKRYIVNGWAELLDLDHGDRPWNPGVKGVAKHIAYIGLLRLAAVYADHPDYREEWKP